MVQTRKLHGRFLHITDFHPDRHYKPHTSTRENDACHHGKGPAGVYGAETSDCDSPVALVQATFDWLAAQVRDEIDFVIWTGDSARHDSDESIQRSEKEVLDSNRMLADKFAEVFSDADGMAVPVVPTFGNNDILPHNVMAPGPNRWLREYLDVWKAFIPEEQKHSFEFGGWFYTEVIPNQLVVFSLNTLYFFDRNAGIDDCVNPSEPGYKQLAWLDVQLDYLRSRGMKAILMGHVPPARTSSKQLWDETCWQKYTLWLRQYRDVVVGATYGHMNIDHFMLQDEHDIDIKSLTEGSNSRKKGKKGRKHSKSLPSSIFGEEDDDEHDGYDEDDDQAFGIMSSTDYLLDLRAAWSKLPKTAAREYNEVETDIKGHGKKKKKKGKKKKGKKNKDIGGAYAERFQLSLISPSIVPNYLPTYRIIEYNITGLEHAPTWADTLRSKRPATTTETGPGPAELRRREESDLSSEKKNKKGNNKDKNLIIPDGPSSTEPPGPAYSPQPLSWTGYTQYFANLTYINNDMTKNGHGDVYSGNKWSEGKHSGKKPQHKPKPRDFNFEVEYSTFKDGLYKLDDLTVRSFVDLAYRLGQTSGKSANGVSSSDEEDTDNEDEAEDMVKDETDDESDDDDVAAEKHKKKKKKKKKHGKHKAHTKIWLHFLKHAFVSTLSEEELEKL